MPIGRNEPCPCGSGKKFKKCHGAQEASAPSPAAARASVLKAADVALGDRLLRFARMRHGPRWLEDVLDAEGLLDDTGELAETDLPFVIPWLEHFRTDDAGATLAAEWSRHELLRVSADERLLLRAYDAAWVSIWEVADVQPGVGSRLTDLLTQREAFVHDVRSTATLRRFDAVLAIVLSCDGVSFFGGVHAQPLTPRFAELAVREAKRMCRVRTRPVSPAKLRDAEMQLELLDLWNMVVATMLARPLPVMHNTDGDPFALTRDNFSLSAPRDEVARRLESLTGVQEPEADGDDTVFSVTKAGNALLRSWDNTIIGRIVLSDTGLMVETNSTRRADALRSAVEEHLGELVRFRLRKEENTAQLLADARARAGRPAERPEEELPPEAVAALREFRERHMHDWLDMTIPALGGLTPREAARQPRARQKLEVVLKEIEQTEARHPEAQRLDLRWLRDELGLP